MTVPEGQNWPQLKTHTGAFNLTVNISMVPTGSHESKWKTFQGRFQDQISCYKDIHGEFHNADIPEIYHIYVV